MTWTYDNAGRQTTEYMVPKGKSGCYDVRTLNAARTYDAENHMLKTTTYVPSGSVENYETLGWGANGKVRSDFLSINGKTNSLHWDGDELLFVTDQGGALIQLNVERLGSVTMTIAPTINVHVILIAWYVCTVSTFHSCRCFIILYFVIYLPHWKPAARCFTAAGFTSVRRMRIGTGFWDGEPCHAYRDASCNPIAQRLLRL